MKTFSYSFLLIGLFFTIAAGQEQYNEAEILMRLDSDFDEVTAVKGVEGWVEFFAPNGSMLSDTNRPISGLDEIRKAMEPAFKDSSFSLRWCPRKAEIMIPGILGYTVGRFERLRKNKEGKLMKSTGTYSSIWKKQPNGSWRIVLDTGNSDGPPMEVLQ